MTVITFDKIVVAKKTDKKAYPFIKYFDQIKCNFLLLKDGINKIKCHRP